MKPGWLVVIAALVGLVLGVAYGWNLAENSANGRYVRALAEKHEASVRYWDTQTNNIITNNTLERKTKNGKKAN